jgi:hypothetical protein
VRVRLRKSSTVLYMYSHIVCKNKNLCLPFTLQETHILIMRYNTTDTSSTVQKCKKLPKYYLLFWAGNVENGVFVSLDTKSLLTQSIKQ